MGETRGDPCLLQQRAKPLKTLYIGKTLRQALHRVFAQNQVLSLQNVIHVRSLRLTAAPSHSRSGDGTARA